MSRAGLVNVLCHRCRADEAHRGDVRMLEQPVDGNAIALYDVEHAFGQPRLLPELREPERRRWIALRRLEHEAISRGDGDWEHPHRYHHREVERSEASHHAQRRT